MTILYFHGFNGPADTVSKGSLTPQESIKISLTAYLKRQYKRLFAIFFVS
jgi:hypothetical protein